MRVEQARILGHQPPGKDTFAEVSKRYSKHQRARLTPKAYDREEGIVRKNLDPKFGERRAASIRKLDVQRYVTEVSTERSAFTVKKELVVLKHLFSFHYLRHTAASWLRISDADIRTVAQ